VSQYFFLFPCLDHFIFGYHMRLLHSFDSDWFIGLPVPAEPYFPKGTPADSFDALVILEAGFVALLP
jgi:hypothetical protein